MIGYILRLLETSVVHTHLSVITRFDGLLQWRLPRVRSCPGWKGAPRKG
jgi:hypothetical protein